jgi:DegV family protein with EDD domain
MHIVHGGVVEMKRNAHDQNEEQEGRLEVDSMTQEVDSKTQSMGGESDREQRKSNHRWKLVSDSGCSLLVPDGLAGIDIDYAEVPFVISVDNTDYIDESGIDIEKMLEHIAICQSGGRTSCPSPHAWLEAWGDAENVIAFTLSAALSGSYNSAIAARHMALEKNPGRNIAVINTCGAGVFPEQLANIIYEGIEDGDSFDAIVSAADKAVREIQVMFALGSLDNLIKAGRLNKLVGYAAHRFNISAIGVASPGGRIELRHKFRGMKKIYGKLIDTLRETGFAGGELVISHCMNEDGAEKLGHLIKAEWLDADVSIVPASGLCSYYMGKGGMIITYRE